MEWALRSATTTTTATSILFVTSFGPDTLFRNNGNGTFTDVTEEAGVSDPLWSASATFFDYDRDGDLDLFVANYLDFTVAGNKTCTDTAGAPDYCGPRNYRPVPDRLYRNDGNGRFTDVTESVRHQSRRRRRPGRGRRAITTTTAGWICTSPTTPRRISSGSIGTMARSPMKACSRVRR